MRPSVRHHSICPASCFIRSVVATIVTTMQICTYMCCLQRETQK